MAQLYVKNKQIKTLNKNNIVDFLLKFDTYHSCILVWQNSKTTKKQIKEELLRIEKEEQERKEREEKERLERERIEKIEKEKEERENRLNEIKRKQEAKEKINKLLNTK